MDHNALHQHHLGQNSHMHGSHHWNYTSPPIASMTTPLTSTPIAGNKLQSAHNNTWTPPSTRSMKRAHSESDCDDIYSEESSKEQ